MIRRRYGKGLRRASWDATAEDVDPNAYITNVADCMLVLMLGFMVAFISYYGIELQQEEAADEVVGIEVDMDADGDGEIDGGYEEAGTVYRDSATGKYYLVE